VRAAVIYNPSAKGDKARAFRKSLDEISRQCTLLRTESPGDATRLADNAVRDGYDALIAAGGDGTLNEVLNGIAKSPGGLERVRLGVLPLGTVNVFARELGLPTRLRAAWPILCQGNERRIDLPYAEWVSAGQVQRRYFAQLAGAGLDARAIELTRWSLKKRIGPLAYVVAGFEALAEARTRIVVRVNGQTVQGPLVLLGNGSRYGGSFQVFPNADVTDGLIEVCVFPHVNWRILLQCGLSLLTRRRLPETCVVRMRASSAEITTVGASRFEVEGELAGQLPATFGIVRQALRVLVPR
jgi:YegS/Rv2252/BmrU family lipid kinase